MRHPILVLALVIAMAIGCISATATSQLQAQETTYPTDRGAYVSDASHAIAIYRPSVTERTPESMAAAGQKFLKSLTKKLALQVRHPIDSAERRDWTNLPANPNAGGARLGDFDKEQIHAFCNLMATLMSRQGYQKMVNIMLADDQLLKNGRPRRGFGTENFAVVVFGDPSPTKPWAFQLDGHHVGVNLSVTGDKLCMSPSFIGTQPQAFSLGQKKVRPLTGEIDDAYKLIGSLSAKQREKAVIQDRRGRILAGPGRDNRLPPIQGLACSELSEKQQALLFKLIEQWVNDLPEKHAKARIAEIKSGLKDTYFSWNGAVMVNSDISYRIQGPTLIIEYACQDLGGDPQQHLHTMYRNPKNEYGLQIGKQGKK